MTKAADQLEDVLEPRFPGVRFGRYNCRTISGSSTYSQHAWPGGNARDIYAPVDHDDPAAFLDEVNTWLAWNTEALSIRLILWRTRDHYSHIHTDFWPHGYELPPCVGGDSRYQYSDGHTVFIVDPEPENGYYQPEGDDEMFVKQGDHSPYVEYWQNHLAYLAGLDVSESATVYLPQMTPPLAPGLYDAAMAAHVKPFGYGASAGVGIGPGEAMRILKAAYEKGSGS